MSIKHDDVKLLDNEVKQLDNKKMSSILYNFARAPKGHFILI